MRKSLKISLIVIVILVILLIVAYYLIMNSDKAIEKAKDEIKNGFDCSEDSYNCDNFQTQKGAQNAYDFCMTETGKDIHQLDNDGDKEVCESLG